MVAAWEIQKMEAVEKVGDYNFRIQFSTEEEKNRVLEGGPWRHKGDAVIVVHYDGLTRPSEVHISSINLWVRFYDLPPVMMESFARQLSQQVGRYLKVDTRYPGYLRFRIEFPLDKPLVPSMKFGIKSKRGVMEINLRYESVPHFCFSCGRIGHAVVNCEEGPGDGSIPFGEELRASPPKRVREISITPGPSRVVKSLFQVGTQTSNSEASGSHKPRGLHGRQHAKGAFHMENECWITSTCSVAG
jgi:hypothetical protein